MPIAEIEAIMQHFLVRLWAVSNLNNAGVIGKIDHCALEIDINVRLEINMTHISFENRSMYLKIDMTHM